MKLLSDVFNLNELIEQSCLDVSQSCSSHSLKTSATDDPRWKAMK